MNSKLYIEREKPKIIECYLNADEDITSLLKSKYPYILDSINEEGYKIEYDNYKYFRELVYDNKVVGFASFSSLDETVIGTIYAYNLITLNECYILPEFRGNGITYNLIIKLLKDPNYEFYIRKPNRKFINLLIRNNLAVKLSKNVVYSYLRLAVSTDEAYKNRKISNFYHPRKEPEVFIDFIYDLDLCSFLFMDENDRYIKEDYIFALSNPRVSDLKKYKCRKKLRRVDENYLFKTFMTIMKNESKWKSLIDECEKHVDELYDIENIIGSENNFTDEFKNLLKEKNLSTDDGVKIYNHIKNRLDEGVLDSSSIRLRLNYLLENMDYINTPEKIGFAFEECTYCGNTLSHRFLKVCRKCGHVFGNEKFDPIASVLGKIESFDDELDESNPDYEINKVFADCLLEYSYREFYEFYNQQSDEKSPEEIATEFAENKLKESINNNDSYKGYLNYLNYKVAYDSEYGTPEQHMVSCIQYLILSSNRPYDNCENCVIENPTAINVLWELENLEDFEYNEKYCDEAYETFRLPEYANNHKEVSEFLNEFFLDRDEEQDQHYAKKIGDMVDSIYHK